MEKKCLLENQQTLQKSKRRRKIVEDDKNGQSNTDPNEEEDNKSEEEQENVAKTRSKLLRGLVPKCCNNMKNRKNVPLATNFNSSRQLVNEWSIDAVSREKLGRRIHGFLS